MMLMTHLWVDIMRIGSVVAAGGVGEENADYFIKWVDVSIIKFKSKAFFCK